MSVSALQNTGPPGPAQVEFVTFLRGFSISTIVMMHYFGTLPHLPRDLHFAIAFGGTGVHAFVFVSAFGLGLSRMRRYSQPTRSGMVGAAPLELGPYYLGRFRKVYLPYLAVVSLIALICLAVPVYESTAYSYFGHALLYKMFDESIVGSYGYPLWFMSLILQFYAVYPGLLRLYERWQSWTIFGCAMISVSWWWFVISTGKAELRIYNGALPQFLWEIALGLALAWRFQSRGFEFWNCRMRATVIVTVICAVLHATLAHQFGAVGRVLNDVPALIAYTGMCIAIFSRSPPGVRRFVAFMGRIGFPVYLIHMFVRDWFLHLVPTDWPFREVASVMAASALLLPLASWLAIFFAVLSPRRSARSEQLQPTAVSR
ncbi:MAG: acyltransferase [Polyangiaceae bacterium]|nr:acyltransferase [Polyangiaceae bacterium]